MRTESKPRPPLVAYAWRTGVIGFNYYLPEGALIIAVSRNEKWLRDLVNARAHRSCIDENELVVPGFPGAKTSMEEIDALMRFSNEIISAMEC